MAAFTREEHQRILDAFNAMDPESWGAPVTWPDWETTFSFFYEGQITLEGLLHIADVIAAIRHEKEPVR